MRRFIFILLILFLFTNVGYAFINVSVPSRDESIKLLYVTCQDTGDANPGALSITPSSASLVLITNNDANGCDLTLGEIAVKTGHDVIITVISNAGGTVDITDAPGVYEGAGNTTLDIWDVVGIVYLDDRWAEKFESNN